MHRLRMAPWKSRHACCSGRMSAWSGHNTRQAKGKVQCSPPGLERLEAAHVRQRAKDAGEREAQQGGPDPGRARQARVQEVVDADACHRSMNLDRRGAWSCMQPKAMIAGQHDLAAERCHQQPAGGTGGQALHGAWQAGGMGSMRAHPRTG